MTINRRQMLGYSASALSIAAFGLPRIASAQANELVIAYNVNLPSWDPTTGPSAVNPTIQGIYQSVFDQFIPQAPDLSFGPGLLTEWRWSDDKKQVHMTVREGVTWHDGSPFSAEDVVWSLERAGKEAFNFQVNLLLWGLVGLVLCLTCILSPLGLVLLGGALIANLVLTAVAAVRTSSGEDYRYPFTIRFLD